MEIAPLDIVMRLGVALLLALPTAWHREANTRIMGLRTFPLVSVGSCAYMLVGMSFVPSDSPDAMARLVQGIVSGIGFVGGGAILKDDDRVKGTASAASIWVIGSIGIACALENWVIALSLSVLNFIVIAVFGMFKTDPDQ